MSPNIWQEHTDGASTPCEERTEKVRTGEIGGPLAWLLAIVVGIYLMVAIVVLRVAGRVRTLIARRAPPGR
ncbi:MAG: hypothetical protein ACTHMG_16395 [Sphingomonas sp.]